MQLDPILAARDLKLSPELVLLDCRPDERAYEAGHLANAIHAQLERDLSSAQAADADPARGGRHPLPEPHVFAALLGRWGITPASHVVAYDDQNGANAAARGWWLLRALGHERVQVVDGGLAALLAHGHTLTAQPAHGAPAPDYPAARFALPIASADDVERARTSAGERVLDVRAAFRYRGESEPIDPIAGHIPGAHNLPFSENLREDGTFKDAAALRAQYEAVLGSRAPEQLIVHCGSGVTACHTLLALARAGLPGARLYVGSWSEWCRNPERPRVP